MARETNMLGEFKMINGKFETQAEIYQALLDGKKIINDCGEILFLKGGNLNDYFNFTFPAVWSLYQEPEKPKEKRLYAHKVHGSDEIVFMSCDGTYFRKDRAPEYDFIYPEEK